MKKQELFNNATEGFTYQRAPQQTGLYDAAYEHDACGVGMLVNIHGQNRRRCRYYVTDSA